MKLSLNLFYFITFLAWQRFPKSWHKLQLFFLPRSKTSKMEFLAPDEIVQKEIDSVLIGIAEGGARTRDLEVDDIN